MIVFSSINNCSRLVFIINRIKSRHRMMEISLVHNKTMNTRIRRDFLRENTINDRDSINFYSDNDERYLRNQPEEIAEPKRTYYLPMNNKLSKLII